MDDQPTQEIVKTEEHESNTESIESAFLEDTPDSPDSGIDGELIDDLGFLGDFGGMVGHKTLDEMLFEEDQVNKLAQKLEPALDNNPWEDSFLDLFPSLMAV